jgi:hypothetical protein
MADDQAYLIFVCCLVGVPATIIAVRIFREGVALPGKGWDEPLKGFARTYGPLILLSIAVVALPWCLLVALWGLKAGVWLSWFVFLGSVSIMLTGGFGGQWVGPGASEAKSRDENWALVTLPGGAVWIVVSQVVSAYFQFDGWAPNPF